MPIKVMDTAKVNTGRGDMGGSGCISPEGVRVRIAKTTPGIMSYFGPARSKQKTAPGLTRGSDCKGGK